MRTGGWGAGLVMLGVGWVDGAMSVRMEAGWSGHGAGPHQPTLPPTLYPRARRTRFCRAGAFCPQSPS